MPQQPILVPYTCEQCGVEFMSQRARLARGQGRYCSRACYAAARSTRVERTCEQCGETFLAKAAMIVRGQARFCSWACHNASKRRGEERCCAQCGEPFWVPRAKSKIGQGRFCSHACHGAWAETHFSGERHPLWRGGARWPRLNDVQRAAYKRWRWAVFERDGFQCQACGTRCSPFHAHHVKPWAEFPDLRYDVANGITLCVMCHRAAHRKRPPKLSRYVQSTGYLPR